MRVSLLPLVVQLQTLLSSRRLRSERGDVPGWVLITLMTAALVLVLWGLASNSFNELWERVMGMVGGIGE